MTLRFPTLNAYAEASSGWIRLFKEHAPTTTEADAQKALDAAVERLRNGSSHEAEREWLAARGVFVSPPFEVEGWCMDPRPLYMSERGLAKLKARWVSESST